MHRTRGIRPVFYYYNVPMTTLNSKRGIFRVRQNAPGEYRRARFERPFFRRVDAAVCRHIVSTYVVVNGYFYMQKTKTSTTPVRDKRLKRNRHRRKTNFIPRTSIDLFFTKKELLYVRTAFGERTKITENEIRNNRRKWQNEILLFYTARDNCFISLKSTQMCCKPK